MHFATLRRRLSWTWIDYYMYRQQLFDGNWTVNLCFTNDHSLAQDSEGSFDVQWHRKDLSLPLI